jgi:hypothetical protein
MANNGTLKLLKENWFIIIVVASVIGSWNILNYKCDNNTQTIAKYIEEVTICKMEIRDIKKDITHLTDIMKRNEDLLKETRDLIKENYR